MDSEFDFLAKLRRRLRQHKQPPALIIGIGDDAAVMRGRSSRDSVVSADLLVEDVDFRFDWMPPRLLGHKALAVSLSDIAAMGARPRWLLLSLGVPTDVWQTDFVNEFYEGFLTLAAEHRATLIGGDLSQTPDRIVVDSIVIAEIGRGRAVRRAGARAGDVIYVTGGLGGAAAGLQLLEDGGRLTNPISHKLDARAQLMLRQLCPQPRTAWGARLGERKLASAMIDLSDGLSSDLAHLCRASQVGAVIDSARIPVNSFVDLLIESVQGSASAALELALHGGEDYELLFTISPKSATKLPKSIGGVTVTRIGHVTDEAGVVRITRDGSEPEMLEPKGFVHFKRVANED